MGCYGSEASYHFEYYHTTLGRISVQVQHTLLPTQVPVTMLGKAADNSPHKRVPAAHVGYLHSVLDSGFCLTHPGYSWHLVVNQGMKNNFLYFTPSVVALQKANKLIYLKAIINSNT